MFAGVQHAHRSFLLPLEVNAIPSHQSASLWVDYDEAIVFLLSPGGSAPNHPTVVFNHREEP